MSIHCCCTGRPIQKYAPHTHSRWEIICQIEGEATVTVEGETFPLLVGDVLLIPPHALRKGVSANEFRDLTLRDSHISFPSLAKIHDHTGDITALLLMIHRIVTERAGDYESIARSLTDAACKLIERELDMRGNPHVEQMKCLLYKSLSTTDFSLPKSIAETGYSQIHFNRLFKQETGKTPLQYLTELRLTHAKRLLCDHHRQSIETIAHECGFADSFYFSKCFKKHVGTSPQGYRNTQSK